ncbi:unnamed protein product [Chrysodeixis includens]|uniref:Uncharacterized protein n=1 Tax=Chrysodeixis includens TaxID=689277 RepID=A0A9P0H071_CHRIL|nr:unnamed protein product [Chrysodeixis includens]
MSSSTGYILDLNQMRKSQKNNVVDVQRHTIESLSNTNQKKKCKCSENHKSSPETDGYIIDLQQNSNLSKNASQGYTIEPRTNTSCHKCCVCKKPSKVTSETSGYILELSQYKEKNATESFNKKNNCKCSEGHKKPSETAGCIVDLGHLKQELPTKTHKLSKNIFGIQKGTIELKKSCGCSVICNKQSSSEAKSLSRGYVMELDQYKKSCACRKSSQMTSEPPGGYTVDLSQYKQNQGQDQNKTCKCNQDKKQSDSFIGRQLSNTLKTGGRNTSEIKTNCQTNCDCQKPSKTTSEPPGYILELDQYKKEQGKNQGDSCNCDQGKKKSSGSATQLSNIPKNLSKTSTEIKTNTNCHKSCVCKKPSKLISDPPGYILELDQYKKEQGKSQGDSCNCGQGKKTPPSSATQLSNKPKDLSKTSTEIKTNTKCCACPKPSKHASEPPGYILELDQYKKKQEKSQGDSCNCGQGKKTPPSSATQLSNKPKDLSKTSTEIKTNTNCHKSCVCKKPSKLISDPPGYILELDQYKKEQGKSQGDSCNCGQGKKTPPSSATQLSNKPKDLSKTSTEIKTNTNCHKSCVCKKPSKLISDPPGYILELDQYKKEQGKSQGDSCNCGQGKKTPPSSATQLSNKPKDLSKTSTEIKTNTNCHKSCVCKKPSKLISDPPGYILELDQYKKEQGKSQGDSCKCGQGKKTPPSSATQLSNKPKDLSKTSTEIKTNTKCCACPKPSKHASEPPGYILELDQYKKKQGKSQGDSCNCGQGKKTPPSSATQLSNKPKDLSKTSTEIKTNTNCHKSCVCKKPSKLISDPPGYILELDQYKKEQGKSQGDSCKCGQGKKTPPSSATQLSNKPKDLSKTSTEIKTNTNCHKSCVCKKPSKLISDPPGYILELDQYKKEQGKSQGDSCNCGQGKKTPPSSATQLSNKPKDLSKTSTEIKTNTNCHKSCVCKKPSKLISDPPGYILELDQYKKEQGKSQGDSCKCGQGKKTPPSSATQLSNKPKDLSKTSTEIKTNTNCHKSCVCKKPSKLISDPPGYILELDQYKKEQGKSQGDSCKCGQGKKTPPSSATQLSNKPKDLSKTSTEIKTNTSCQKCCACPKPSKLTSEPPGYILELDQYKQDRARNKDKKCKCSDPNKKMSELSGYIVDLQEYKQKPTNKAHVISKNIFEVQRNTIETQIKGDQKKKCTCGDSQNRSSRGYVLDLQQYRQTQPKNNCSCNDHESAKKRSNSAGYIVDLKQYKQKARENTQSETCHCKKSNMKTFEPITCCVGDTELKENKIKTPTNTATMSNSTCNCQVSEPSRSNFKKIPGPTKNALEVCKNIYGLQLDYKKSENDDEMCNCNQTQTNKIDIPKFTKVSLNDTKETCNCEQTSPCKFGLPDLLIALHKRVPTDTIIEMCKTILDNDKQDNRTLANETPGSSHMNQDESCMCDGKTDITAHTQENKRLDLCDPRVISKTIEKLKKIYLPSTKAQKNSYGICDPVEMSSAIEKLKKIYLPSTKAQKNSSGICDPVEMSSAIEKLKKVYLPQGNTQKSSPDLCNPVEISKTLENLNTVYLPATKTQKHTSSINKPLESLIAIEKLKKDYLPQSDTQKNSSEFCDQVEMSKTIEKLKKVYLPQANTQNKTSDLCDQVKISKAIEKLKTIYLPQTRTQKSTGLCDPLEASKIIEKLKMFYLPPTKTQKTTFGFRDPLEKLNTIDKGENFNFPASSTTKDRELNTQTPYKQASSEIQKLKNTYLPPRYTLDYPKTYEHSATEDQPVHCHTEAAGTAKWSAQVMDSPCTDFQNSSSHKQENICGKAHKLTKHEIFKRIQEAYKACSCKVCECIIGNSSFSKQSKDICNCKPCECNDCISYLDKMNHEPPAKQLSTTHEGNCSCIRCDKRHCKGVDQQQTCDCKPCDCVKCTHLTQPCDCDPCQCVVCQRRKKLHKQRTLVVAPVGQSVQRVSCTCSPCECIECGGFPATSRVTNETSTATNRHAQCRCEICLNEHCENSAVNFCRCESQKGVINKPVAKGSHDYDIRTASVVLKRQKIKDKIKLSSRHDTVAMFAAVPYAFPTHSAKSIPSVTKTYSCEKCECVSCDCKENGINSNKPSQLFTLNNLPTLSKHAINSHFKTNSPQNYNCANFENKTCDDSLEQKTNCMSNVCDCINCAEESKVTKYTLNDSKGQCIDNEIKIISGMGHTYQCSKYIYEESYRDDCRSNQIVHPIQRGEILSPTSHRSEVKNQKFEKQCHETPIHSNECETLNCNTSMPCQEMNRTNPLPINNYTDIKISGSSFSGYSSLETSPKTSCHIGFGGVAPFLQSKNKSWESSCNSSGHDYPDYLIQFPKSTVETCLKDVMKLNMDRTITIDKFNIIPKKGSVQYQANSMSNELMSGVDYILTPSHGSNIMNSCDCKTVTAKCTESINQYHDVLDCNHYAYTPWDTDVVESTSCNCKFEIQKSNRPGNFENVQTSELSHHNYSECIEDNTSITVTECETKTETRKCFHILQKFSDVHVACKMLQCNPSEHKSANNLFQIENEEYYTRKSSNPISEGIFVGDVETSNNDEIYTRVQKSLKEAKEYSAQLKQLLDMYEKANKEFESVTDKLKIPQVSVSKDAVLEENEIQKMFVKEEGFIEIEHELQERPLEARSVKEVLTCSSILQESIKPEKTFAECENNFNTISEKMGQTELITSSDYETCNLSIGECDPKNKLNTANENQTFVGNETALINEIDNNSNNSLYPNKSIDAEPRDKDSIHDIKSLSTDYQRIRKKDRTNAKHYRKYSKLLKRTIIISKRISLNNSNLNTSPNTIVKYCVTEGTSAVELNTNVNNDKNHSIPVKNYSDKESSDSSEDECVRKYRENVILKKLNSVFGSEEVSVSASTDTYGIERDILSLNESGNSLMAQEFEEAKPWPILKKNYFSSKQNAKNNGVCIFPSLELQIKQAVQSISLQTSSTFTSTNKSVAYHANKALEQLQDEVKKLLDTPILQPQTASICGYNTKESFNVQPENKLELELNETPEESVPSTLKDVESVDKEARCSFTREAVESLIKDLHDLSMTRSFETGTEVLQKTTVVNEKNDNTPKIITPKCSCEALKVGFLYVRRVSDHTVLVKWNVPRKLDKVHGYELLVDGRAVQKIFSPTKSMAVVTCLPHTDKVLLTIRTITSSVFVTGHYPATTIIYQPRVK